MTLSVWHFLLMLSHALSFVLLDRMYQCPVCSDGKFTLTLALVKAPPERDSGHSAMPVAPWRHD
jgi:hypothetical protein